MSQPAAKERRAIPGLRHVCEAIIYQHVFSNAEREVGGVLVGRIAKDGTKPMVIGAIPAIAADEKRAALTFTQDAWEHVHRVLDAEYPDDRIVGWYHSHPSFGIFLSGHDLFIHRNFFSGRSQIALVIDPVAQEEGVFAWRPSTNDVDLYTKGPTPAGWYALGKGGQALPPRASSRSVDSKQDATPSATFSLPVIALAALAGFAVAFGISFAVTRDSGSTQQAPRVRTSQVPAAPTRTRGKVTPTRTTTAGAATQSSTTPTGPISSRPGGGG